jgi:myo-inositol-1(or 4)-monophosphatase
MSEAEAIHALAVRLAREAGAIQRERYETALEVASKSRPIDLVTEVDRACEAHIVGELRRARPHDDVLAEEGGAHADAGAAWRWVIDPLDGTVNYAHGYPCFCVSIGVEYAGARTVGVVYDPLRDECFDALRGRGAHRNGRRIHVSQAGGVGMALLATGFAYDVRDSEADNVAQFARAV